MTVVEELGAARALIAERGYDFHAGSDMNSERHGGALCPMYALAVVQTGTTDVSFMQSHRTAAERLLRQQFPKAENWLMSNTSDRIAVEKNKRRWAGLPDYTTEEILAAFDRAIEQAKALPSPKATALASSSDSWQAISNATPIPAAPATTESEAPLVVV